jgi:UDP-N-acetylglucosamine--N-acetylmuramyl-(pentapeptide) pyrophosphoryl-undecaprenol N-acetylglucosamine transferase
MTLVNADAARVIEEKDLTQEKLLETVKELLDNKTLRDKMGENAQKIAVADACDRIAEIIVSLA